MSDPAPGLPERESGFDLARDRARLKRSGALHFVMVMGAVTLWGTADAWAASTGWVLAQVVAMANAVIAAYILSSTLHEWGHFAGARLSGAMAPALKKPVRYFFMFDFPFEANDKRQFVWMSLGGILVPWVLVALTPLLVPIDNASRALLLAAFVARAVTVSYFEVPVVLRAQAGGDPKEELGRQLRAGALDTGRYVGFAAGAVAWLAA